MKLHYDDATEAFRAELGAWLDEHAPDPAEMAADPPQSSAHLPDWARRWQRTLFDAGWLVPGWPPELGGRNATPVQQMVYFEELSKRDVPRSPNQQGLAIIAPSLVDFGNEDQVARYCLPLLRGEKSGCLGMSEPGAGSDLAGLTTKAVLDGDHFVVNGQKVWTSGAQHADFCFCFVRTDPEAPKHKGISLLIIDLRTTPGITIRPLAQAVSPNEADFNEVFFNDAVVPRENLLGELHKGWAIATGSLSHERKLVWLIEATGNRRRIERLVELARTTAGPRGRLADDPVVRDRLAHFYISTEALFLIGYRGVAKMGRGEDSPEHSVLKLFGSETGQQMALTATDLLGPHAVSMSVDERDQWDAMFDLWASAYFRSFVNTIAGGTSEIQRNIISERVLGLPRR